MVWPLFRGLGRIFYMAVDVWAADARAADARVADTRAGIFKKTFNSEKKGV